MEQHNPRIHVRSVTGSLRLDNDADVTMARVMVAIANKASRDISRRVKRKMDELAAAGRPSGGRRAFGYEKDGMTLRPDEAAIISELAMIIASMVGTCAFTACTGRGCASDQHKPTLPCRKLQCVRTISVQIGLQRFVDKREKLLFL